MSDPAKVVRLFSGPNYGGTEKPLDKNSPDLTGPPINFPNGASSVKVGANQTSWRVFTDVDYNGASAILSPGKDYASLEVIGLAGPIKSMRIP